MTTTTKRPVALFLAVALLAVGVFLTARAWGHAGPPDPAHDGFIDASEACTGGLDFTTQDDTWRAWGGVLLVPPSLPNGKRVALAQAAAIRLAETGAVWRLVTHDGPLSVGLDGMLVASCGPEMPIFSAAHKNPSGSIGIRWDLRPPSEWAAGIAATLAQAEGAGPLLTGGGL